MIFVARKQYLLAAIVWPISCTARSNGILYAGLITYDLVVRMDLSKPLSVSPFALQWLIPLQFDDDTKRSNTVQLLTSSLLSPSLQNAVQGLCVCEGWPSLRGYLDWIPCGAIVWLLTLLHGHHI